MSRSVWKGPFNQNIDKHEKKLPAKTLLNKPQHNVSKNSEFVKQALPLPLHLPLPVPKGQGQVQGQLPKLLSTVQSKQLQQTQYGQGQEAELALLAVRRNQNKPNTRGPSVDPSKKSTGSLYEQSSALPHSPYALTKPRKSSKKETKPEEKKKVWSRSSMVLPHYVGRSFFIHNGKTFISIQISPKMLGHKFGEFASTRQKPIHKKKK